MIGAGISRTDGPLKVAGLARYSLERREPGKPLHAVILGSAIAYGRITRIDATPGRGGARRAAGADACTMRRNSRRSSLDRDMHDANAQLVDDRIQHFGQPVALVVADDVRAGARGGGADRGRVRGGARGLRSCRCDTAGKPKDESRIGDLEAAMAAAPVTVDVDLHDALPLLAADGAQCLHRRLARRAPHRSTSPRRCWRSSNRRSRRRSISTTSTSRSTRRSSAAGSARRSGFMPRRCWPRWRRMRLGAAGEARDDAPADLQSRGPSRGDHAPHPPRGDGGRHAHRARPRLQHARPRPRTTGPRTPPRSRARSMRRRTG